MSEDDTQMILAMAERISELQEENQKLRGTLGTAYNDLEEVMDEKQKLVNHHYQKRLEAEERLKAIREIVKFPLPKGQGFVTTVRKIREVLGGDS